MASYATQADLANYLNPLSWQNVASSAVDAELESASRRADDYMRGRFNLPLLAWATSITQNVCYLASRNILGARGYNPSAGADVSVETRYEEAIAYFEGIERQRIHPLVTETPKSGVAYQLPQVFSLPSRGW